MLIKWRQEMGSVGLLLSCFSRDQWSHTCPPPPSFPPLSVLLTYIYHSPPQQDISAASGNYQGSTQCRDVTHSTTKQSKSSSLQVHTMRKTLEGFTKYTRQLCKLLIINKYCFYYSQGLLYICFSPIPLVRLRLRAQDRAKPGLRV